MISIIKFNISSIIFNFKEISRSNLLEGDVMALLVAAVQHFTSSVSLYN